MSDPKKILLIAKYKDGIIKYSEFNRSIHRGNIYCPFCNPSIRVAYNPNGFFMAWRGDGGHNCGKEQAQYFDANWKGRKITEIKRNDDGNLEVIIDINALVKQSTITEHRFKDDNNDESIKTPHKYPVYKDRTEVFRDVIRSVFHMKKILENNSYNALRNIKFKFKASLGEVLGLDEVVVCVYDLNKHLIDKTRFIIFKVDNVVLKENKLYINSYGINGVNLTATLFYPSAKNAMKKLEGEYVIAFGKLTYSAKHDKYFLELSNDFQIQKLKEEAAQGLFDDAEFKKYEPKQKENQKQLTTTEINSTLNSFKYASNNVIQNRKIPEELIKVSPNDNSMNTFDKTEQKSRIIEKNSTTYVGHIKDENYSIVNTKTKSRKEAKGFFKNLISKVFKK